MKCYCISGLGADKRAFQNIEFGFELIHVDWIEPKVKESLSSYSQRLSTQIDNSEPFVLLGLSFGGLIACELSRLLAPEQTILISSLTNKTDLHPFIQLISKTHLHRLIPFSRLKPPMSLTYWLFGINTSANKKLLKSIISDTNPKLLKWSIDKILSTDLVVKPSNLLRIHGTNDRLIPAKKASNVHWIEKGGHFMVLQQATQINKVLSFYALKKPKL
ncbi:alpha/beta fold hydrolase [Salibacter halophilus]|uniref:Alpha/beta hydrolase n=1 Tax=Salibacter halophilus TaxID=1803916 RepID=A0A6N6M9J9_9FLAO|nr:alpha/beta hydrolase [Salibacter halophilus]KAB1065892.1 alpha/beta hydrolase [Salibacter halophilus]